MDAQYRSQWDELTFPLRAMRPWFKSQLGSILMHLYVLSAQVAFVEVILLPLTVQSV